MKTTTKVLVGTLALVFLQNQTNAQSTQNGLGAAGHTNAGGVAGYYLGWNAASTIPLNIEHRGTDNINFLTGGTNRMTILGSLVPATAGFVGIGTPSPTQRLEVDAGNINIFTNTNAFMLGSQNILWHKGEVRNLFVGVAAGANTAGGNAFENTFVGSRAGFANTVGQRNTFIGANAGESITNGRFNTFVGTEAGKLLTTGQHNTFVGEQAGDKQITGSNNSYFGAHAAQGPVPNAGSGIGNDNTILGALAGSAITNGDGNTFTGVSAGGNCNDGGNNTFTGISSGRSCNTGSRNTMAGVQSGFFTTAGDQNVFLGNRSGFWNKTGSNNTYVGNNSGPLAASAFNALTNASAIGNGSIPRADNKMILGNNLVNVGIGLSNDTYLDGPQNKLEIDAGVNGLDPSPSGAVGTSGLRFRDLHSGNTTMTNPGIGVLSVDALGDVIYVPGSTGLGLGNICGNTPNPLLGDYEIPMNIYNYYFSGQGTGRTNVGVGLPCSTILGGKVHAYQLSNNFFFGSNLGVSVSGRFDNYTSVNAYLGYGVVGNAAGNTSAWNIGVYGTAANAGVSNFAGYFDGDVYITGTTTGVGAGSFSDKNIKTNINTLNKNLEILSKLRPVDYKYDNTYAPQLKLNNHKNYGFIAQEVEAIIPDIVSTTTVLPTFDSLNNVINPEKVVKALNYDGLIPFAIGGIQELNAKQKEMQSTLDKAGLSDTQVKTNVNTFNALAKIKTLQPVQYNFTNANVPQLTFKSNLDYGFVAQQLETVYPELVDTLRIDATYDSLGLVVNPSKLLKTVNYKAMSGLLVRSVQEQQLTIDSLRNTQNAILQQLAALASQINSCCSNTTARNNSNINQVDVELSDKDAIVLNQNVPNPFAEQTTITYNVPESVSKAQIIFYNSAGQIIQTIDVKTRGKGKVNVFASDLSSGLYHYTLVADGKVVDSKKMVRE